MDDSHRPQRTSFAALRTRPSDPAWGLWPLLAGFALAWLALAQPLAAQDLNALINDQPSQSQQQEPRAQANPSPIAINGSQAATNGVSPAVPSTPDQGDGISEQTGDAQESFTPANRCPRCALFSAVQMADSGSSCQDVIFQGAASYSVTGDFESSDMLEVDARNSCRISFFNDSPDRSIVIKLDRALRDLILAPSPDLYSGYLLAPRSSIDLILRPGQIHRSVEARNIVTWQDATQVGDADDSLFKIRISAN